MREANSPTKDVKICGNWYPHAHMFTNNILLSLYRDILDLEPSLRQYVDGKKAPPNDIMDPHYKRWFRREYKGKTKNGRSIIKRRPMAAVETPSLKRIHKSIMTNLSLPVSPHVYSYEKGLSPRDCAARHTSCFAVWGIDIKSFFPSITRTIIEHTYRDLLKTLNKTYKLGLAKEDIQRIPVLLGIVCSVSDIENPSATEAVLPIGIEPATSLSNGIPFDLDEELHSFSQTNGITYTRFSDNMYFSHKAKHIPKDFMEKVVGIIESFSTGGITPFKVHAHKQRYMPYWRQQRILGTVVNEKVNVPQRNERWLRSALNHLYWDTHELDASVDTWAITKQTARNKVRALRHTAHRVFGHVSYFAAVNIQKAEKYSSQYWAIRVLLDEVEYKVAHMPVRRRSVDKTMNADGQEET